MPISKKRLKELEAIKDKDIDTSDIPELGEWFWKDAKVEFPAEKIHTTIRLDKDVVNWFKKKGRGYQTRMNAVLRTYMNAHKS